MKISQREARRNRKDLHELRARIASTHSRWSKEFPGGFHLATLKIGQDTKVAGSISAARGLGHAVVGAYSGDGDLYLYALPLPEYKA